MHDYNCPKSVELAQFPVTALWASNPVFYLLLLQRVEVSSEQELQKCTLLAQKVYVFTPYMSPPDCLMSLI